MAESVIQVVFSPQFSSSAKVVEVSDDIVREVEAGRKLVLKGSVTDEAVLCTEEKTYALKRVEQSNSVFLFQQEKGMTQWELQNQLSDFFETIPIEGKTQGLLKQVQSLDSSLSFEEAVRSLCRATSASDREVHRQLDQLGAINLDNRLHIVTFESRVELAEQFFRLSVLRDWRSASLHENEVLSALPDVPAPIIRHLLSKLAATVAVEGVWSLEREEVVKSIAHVLFLSAKSLSVEDVYREMLLRLPSDLTVSREELPGLLRGVCVEVSSQFVYFPAESAPRNLLQCLRALFSIRSKFSLQELAPYLAVCGEKEEALLLHTRVIDGQYRLKD